MEQHVSEKINKFFSGYKKLSFKKNATILHAKEEPKGVFYLKKGYVRLYSISKDAQELTLIIFRPENIFPLIWAINNTPHIYYMEAFTDVELYQAPRKEFLNFIKQDNEVLLELTGRILMRFHGGLTRMEHAIFGHARSKVVSIILICVERYGKKVGKNIFIQVPLTHQDIANLIGIARETVSLEMEQLQKEGLINHLGKSLVVKNLQKLKKESMLESTP